MPAADLARSIVDTLAAMDVRPRIVEGRLRCHLEHLRPADAADARALIVEHRDELIAELEARGSGVIARRPLSATPTLAEARDPFEVRLEDGRATAAELEAAGPWWETETGWTVEQWLADVAAEGERHGYAPRWDGERMRFEPTRDFPPGTRPYVAGWVTSQALQLERAGALGEALRAREDANGRFAPSSTTAVSTDTLRADPRRSRARRPRATDRCSSADDSPSSEVA